MNTQLDRSTDLHWLGDFPADWNSRRIKRVMSRVDYGISVSTEQEGRFTVLKMGNIQSGEIDFSDLSFVDEVSEDLLLEPGDLLYNRTNSPDEVGKAAIFRGSRRDRFTFASYLVRLRTNHHAEPHFLNYLLNCDGFLTYARKLAIPSVQQSNLNSTRYCRILIPLPPRTEQVRIAAYLDASCAAIDAAVVAKRRQLETLYALRQSTIHRAVTCGLNDSVQLKESALEWLGRTPSHWAIRRIKDIAELRSGDAITSETITPVGDYPVFGGNGFRGFTTSFTHDGYYALIGRQGALCGNINYAKGKFWASEHAIAVTMLGHNDTFWLGELLRAMNLNQYSIAAAQPGLAVDRIKFLRLPVPPPVEQAHIVAYIRAIVPKTEQMVSQLGKQIATLTAYRKSLIHECVTGQQRVTQADFARVGRGEFTSSRPSR